MIQTVARYAFPTAPTVLVVAQGSVLDFDGSCIVNAANTHCLGGGGVDGAITAQGGPNLAADRLKLPLLRHASDDEDGFGLDIRCQVGSAVITGPGNYGRLPNHIIHAVGPNFMSFDDEDDYAKPKALLRSAYASALDLAQGHSLPTIGFSLLSAGIFRGELTLKEVLAEGVQGILDWSHAMEGREIEPKVTEVWMCGFLPNEVMALQSVCDEILGEQMEKENDS